MNRYTFILAILPAIILAIDTCNNSQEDVHCTGSSADWKDISKDAESSVKELRRGIKLWSNGYEPVAKMSAVEGAKELAAKLEGRPLDDIFNPDTLDKLSVPFSQIVRKQWTETGKIFITETEAGSHISGPFGEFDMVATNKDDAAGFLLDIVTEDIVAEASRENIDLRALLEAILKVTVDISELRIPHLMVALNRCLGEVAIALNPVPEYLEDKSVLEGDGKPIRYHDIVQDNWAGTLENTRTIRTYYPLTRQGVVNIVKKAKSENARVRASGLKHSWNHWVWGLDSQYEEPQNPCYEDGYTGDVDYFIAMVPWELSDHLYFMRADIEGWRSQSKELSFVEGPIDSWEDEDGTPHVSIKVGGAALSGFIQEWALENGWYLPSEPMTPLFTMAGVVSTASHGSGRKFPPVADYVIAMEYVDEKGEIQYVDDPYELDATAGSYGLFGIIISLTFKLDKMVYANVVKERVSVPMEEYIPRPGQPLTERVLGLMDESNYYQSWYIFTDHHKDEDFKAVQQVVWKADGKKEDAVELVTPGMNSVAIATQFLIQSINVLMKDTFKRLGTENCLHWMYSTIYANFFTKMPPAAPVVTTAVEAVHFARGFHTNPVRSFEVNVPFRDDGNGNPDWTTFQDVWWTLQDVIKEFEAKDLYPMDMVTEVRLVGGSTRLLDSYYGNKHGTISIDPIGSLMVPNWLWDEFKAAVFERFQKFNTDGGKVRMPRPHLGKEAPTKVAGQRSEEYILDVYGDQIDMFVERYKKVVTSRGSSYEDSYKRFSTKFFDNIFMGCTKKNN